MGKSCQSRVTSAVSRNGWRTKKILSTTMTNTAVHSTTSNSANNDIGTGRSNTRASPTTISSTQTATNKRGVQTLSKRLISFRKWATEEANITVHPAVCIINGEATDGTKGAPTLQQEQQQQQQQQQQVFSEASFVNHPPENGDAESKATQEIIRRVGMVDEDADYWDLYEKTMGCELRTTKDLEVGEVLMTVPKSAMITPDVVAASDAGRAVLGCCKSIISQRQDQKHGSDDSHNRTGDDDSNNVGFWDVFENTTICEQRFTESTIGLDGMSLLSKILQERERSEKVIADLEGDNTEDSNNNDKKKKAKNPTYHLAEPGIISTKAPILAFLIHQRFSSNPYPPVVGLDADSDFTAAISQDGDINALNISTRIHLHEGTPPSFAPYARTLPCTVPLPICWKQHELELLAKCVTGVEPLREVASTTCQLATEFIALVNAGIMHRFPSIFPPGMITWERWIWAASVFTSRILPSACCMDDESLGMSSEKESLKSPREVFDELGVMVPLLDMLNHQITSPQVTWEPNIPETISRQPTDTGKGPHPPRAVVHSKVPKGEQIYTCYGANYNNQHLMVQYGFTMLENSFDEVRFGWGLMDAVGNIPAPKNASMSDRVFQTIQNHAGKFEKNDMVYESSDPAAVNQWWSDDRLDFLGNEAFPSIGMTDDDSFMNSLMMGKKMVCTAARGDDDDDGTTTMYDPIFLVAAFAGTMPISDLQQYYMTRKRNEKVATNTTKEDDSGEKIDGVKISISHQHILRCYLHSFYSYKLEKMLENVAMGLKDKYFHEPMRQLWTKAAEGGVRYKYGSDCGDGGGDHDDDSNKNNKQPTHVDDGLVDDNINDRQQLRYIGWQTFFEKHTKENNTAGVTIEIEGRHYATTPDGCVLTLYDGQLQALQASIDNISTTERFNDSVLKSLEELGFVIEKSDDTHGRNDMTDPFIKQPENTINATTNEQDRGEKQKDIPSDRNQTNKRKEEKEEDGESLPSSKRSCRNR